MKCKKPNSQGQRVEWWLLGARKWGKFVDVSQRAQISSYKIYKFGISNVQYGDYNLFIYNGKISSSKN